MQVPLSIQPALSSPCPPGSVRALAVHPGRPVLASLGLDRFLRLHDTRSRQPLGKVYLKSQLSGAGEQGSGRGGEGEAGGRAVFVTCCLSVAP